MSRTILDIVPEDEWFRRMMSELYELDDDNELTPDVVYDYMEMYEIEYDLLSDAAKDELHQFI